MYGLAFFLLTVLLVSFAISWWWTGVISVVRHHAFVAREGEKLLIRYDVTNRGRFSRSMVELVDTIPFAETAHQHPMLFIDNIKRFAQLEFSVLCDWRGLHQLGPIQVESGWPFGLFVSRQQIKHSLSEIIVYPSTFELQQLPGEGTSTYQHDGWVSDHRKGGQDLFLGIRDYRRGDSLRHVHWPLSAKQGSLAVKEYENVNRLEICILLNLCEADNPGQGKHTPLEYAVKIAASIAEFALRKGYFVSLHGLGARSLDVEAGAGSAWLDVILHALAIVKSDGEQPYSLLLERQLQRPANDSLFLLFDHQGDSLSADEMGLSKEQMMIIRFDQPTFSQRMPAFDTHTSDGSVMIRCGDSITERVQSWAHR